MRLLQLNAHVGDVLVPGQQPHRRRTGDEELHHHVEHIYESPDSIRRTPGPADWRCAGRNDPAWSDRGPVDFTMWSDRGRVEVRGQYETPASNCGRQRVTSTTDSSSSVIDNHSL